MDMRETDYLAGTLPYEVRNESGDWSAYVPNGENQYSTQTDSMACVSFSFLNVLETQIKYLLKQDIDFSDRFLAKQSGTTIHGNTLGAVADTFRQYGCPLEADYPKPDNFTWDEFYATIPTEVYQKCLKYDVSYEWIETTVDSLQYNLKHAPIQLVIPGHAVCGIYEDKDIFKFFDTYSPYIKEHPNAPLYAMKIVLNLRKMSEQEVKLQYVLSFYREPTPEELAFWTGKQLIDFLKTAVGDRSAFLAKELL